MFRRKEIGEGQSEYMYKGCGLEGGQTQRPSEKEEEGGGKERRMGPVWS